MRLTQLAVVLLVFFNSITSIASEDSCISSKKTLLGKIKCLELVKITKSTFTENGMQKVEMLFNQPMNHMDPNGKRFDQRIVLLHKGFSEPMLLQTSGYLIFSVRLAHIAKVFQTNQIQVEHRYFKNSIPSLPNWSYLNIEQSAADFHNITVTFKKLYKKPWVNTGASKGGMTSIYHRYFYPQDVVGTVADVAPLSFSTTDKRYIDFVEKVGGRKFKYCRDKLKAMQIKLLENREVIVPGLTGNFSHLGGADIAFEHSVIETPFVFWQYGKASSCELVDIDADIRVIFNYFQTMTAISGYENKGINTFSPYYFQAATELGGPGNSTIHLKHLMDYDFSISQYTPKGLELQYSDIAMRSIEKWALNSADEIIYVYGEFDPWTAGEFPLSITGKNTQKFYVPQGNHGANFTKLIGNDKVRAVNTLSRWLGKMPITSNDKSVKPRASLDEIEFISRKRLRL
jgi:hypothetical protein